MERHDTLIEQIGKLLTSFKEAQVKHLGYSRVIHGIATANYFRWYGDDRATDQLEEKNMSQFL